MMYRGFHLALHTLHLWYFSLVATSCDFDLPANRSSMSCAGWSIPDASDNCPGFIRTPTTSMLIKNDCKSSNRTKWDIPDEHAIFINAEHGQLVSSDIISPWFGPNGYSCHVTFSILMSGVNVGILHLMIELSDGLKQEIWERTGDQGPEFTEFNTTVPRTSQPFRLVFRFVRGSGKDGFISFKTIILYHCDPEIGEPQRKCGLNEYRCPSSALCIDQQHLCDFTNDCLDWADETEDICSQVPSIGRCDFETDNCGWINIPGFHGWEKNQGTTKTNKTGPKADHTLRSEFGHYLFTEGDRIIESTGVTFETRTPTFMAPPAATSNSSSIHYEQCQIRLFYYPYGYNIGAFKIELVRVNPVNPVKPRVLFQDMPFAIHGQTTWIRLTLPITDVYHKFYIKLSVTILSSLHRVGRPEEQDIRGDFAIDDFSLSPECFGLNMDEESLENDSTYKIQEKKIEEYESTLLERQLLLYNLPPSTSRDQLMTLSDNISTIRLEYYWNSPLASEGFSYAFLEMNTERDADLLHAKLKSRAVISVETDLQGLSVDYVGHKSSQPRPDKNRKKNDPMYDWMDTITEVLNNSKRYQFTTCSSIGYKGPTQYQCDAAYKGKMFSVNVSESETEPEKNGIQVWIVPETNFFSITALGAAGGDGMKHAADSKGGYAHAIFNLTKGDEIHMIVGQQGDKACSHTNIKNADLSNICTQGFDTTHVGGGGGGGGGTYVFKRDPQTDEYTLLLVAGGGGGASMQQGNEPIAIGGGVSDGGPGVSAESRENTPGGGGGWNGTRLFVQGGGSVMEGSLGGSPCPNAQAYGWDTMGGFGGGGGACIAGGGGGGYTGGNVSLSNDMIHSGQGGSSYINEIGYKPSMHPGVRTQDGTVEIAVIVKCECEFLCVFTDHDSLESFQCYCPINLILAKDGIHCLDMDDIESGGDSISTGTLITIVFVAIILFVVVLFAALYALYKHYEPNKKKSSSAPAVIPGGTEVQLEMFRQRVGGTVVGMGSDSGMVSEYNPCYDFSDNKHNNYNIRAINRDHLNLIGQLGKGAFGEVYEGELSNVTTDNTVLGVAVKTLPLLSTVQSERDFLMEAIILNKFDHPNIVKLIGTCFEKMPRFIILELLQGGDLKSFLREARPTKESPSSVMMADLVKLSLDIAKGCQHLEENHFIHRDIAARNCLLTNRGPDRVAKIADFGMARDIYRQDYYRKGGGVAMVPVKWMPPEAFLDGVFSSKTDVWSFGILLWEVFSMGYNPYPGRGNTEVMKMVIDGGRLNKPVHCPHTISMVMSSCWHGFFAKRPSFTYIIEKLTAALTEPDVHNIPLPLFKRLDVQPCHDDYKRVAMPMKPPIPCFDHPGAPGCTEKLLDPPVSYSEQYLGNPGGIAQNPPRPVSEQANLSVSAESLDKLLQDGDAEPEKNPFSYPSDHDESQECKDYVLVKAQRPDDADAGYDFLSPSENDVQHSLCNDDELVEPSIGWEQPKSSNPGLNGANNNTSTPKLAQSPNNQNSKQTFNPLSQHSTNETAIPPSSAQSHSNTPQTPLMENTSDDTHIVTMGTEHPSNSTTSTPHADVKRPHEYENVKSEQKPRQKLVMVDSSDTHDHKCAEDNSQVGINHSPESEQSNEQYNVVLDPSMFVDIKGGSTLENKGKGGNKNWL